MANDDAIAELQQRIDRLENELGIQQDIHAIRRLQYAYGYFIDKSQYDECVDLFAEDSEVWFLGGIYKGKAGVRRLYVERFRNNFTENHNGPRYGWLLDHPQLPKAGARRPSISSRWQRPAIRKIRSGLTSSSNRPRACGRQPTSFPSTSTIPSPASRSESTTAGRARDSTTRNDVDRAPVSIRLRGAKEKNAWRSWPGVDDVVTHHAPSARSVAPRFASDLLTPAFASNLEHLMDGQCAVLWIRGHTHDPFDYEINGTRVICNPRVLDAAGLRARYHSR